MPIEPDTKDWTWVLTRPCPECGFDAATLPPARVAPLVRRNAEGWLGVLAAPEAWVRRRPSEDRWSPLEYACHVRDVFDLYGRRLALMLAEDDPLFANWDQDVTAVEERYNEQDPAVVAAALTAAAAGLADAFAALSAAQWERTGRRSDGATFTVDTFSRYMVHDPIHHLHDVRPDTTA